MSEYRGNEHRHKKEGMHIHKMSGKKYREKSFSKLCKQGKAAHSKTTVHKGVGNTGIMVFRYFADIDMPDELRNPVGKQRTAEHESKNRKKQIKHKKSFQSKM